MAKPDGILRGKHIPELIIIVDDGVDLLATRRHGRGEGSVNGESETGISTPAPNRNGAAENKKRRRRRSGARANQRTGRKRRKDKRRERGVMIRGRRWTAKEKKGRKLKRGFILLALPDGV